MGAIVETVDHTAIPFFLTLVGHSCCLSCGFAQHCVAPSQEKLKVARLKSNPAHYYERQILLNI